MNFLKVKIYKKRGLILQELIKNNVEEVLNKEVNTQIYYAIQQAFNTKETIKVDSRYYKEPVYRKLIEKFAMCFKGGYNSYFTEGISFTEFCNNLFSSSKYNTANNIFKKIVTLTRKNLKEQNIKAPIKEVRLCVLYQLLATRYKGLSFEDTVKEYLQEKGYNVVHASKEQDDEHKLDLIVLKNSGNIAIQVKPESFILHAGTKKLDETFKAQEKAIANGVVTDVFFVFYNYNYKLATMCVQLKAFATKKDIIETQFVSLKDMQQAYKITEKEEV